MGKPLRGKKTIAYQEIRGCSHVSSGVAIKQSQEYPPRDCRTDHESSGLPADGFID